MAYSAETLFKYAPWFYGTEARKVIVRAEEWFGYFPSTVTVKFTDLLKAERLPAFSPGTWIRLRYNLKKREAEKQLSRIVSRFMVSLFYGPHPVIFEDESETYPFASPVIEPELIHGGRDKIMSALAAEQLSMLLEAKGITPDTDDRRLPVYDWVWKTALAFYGDDAGEHLREGDDGYWYLLLPADGKWVRVDNFRLPASLRKDRCYSYIHFAENRFPRSQPPGAASVRLKEALDKYQYRAVLSGNGPVQVLAPAGSGKTRTLIYRIVRLIIAGVEPSSIMALAFNRRAMEEMRERVRKSGISGVKIFTLHAFGLQIIKHFLPQWKFGGDEESDTSMAAIVAHTVFSLYKVPRGKEKETTEKFIEAVHRVKSTLIPPEEIDLTIDERRIDFREFFDLLLKNQTKQRYYEYADMIYLAIRLLLKNPDFRRRLQTEITHVLVDEFQDLNEAQIMMIEILMRPLDNLFAVGDDDQLIYGWRGADIGNILHFGERFGKFRRHILQYNYRSPRTLVEHGERLISRNRKRVVKKITSRREDEDGTVLEVISAAGLKEEAEAAAEKIAALLASGVPPGDIALVARFNIYLFAASLLLEKRKISYTLPDYRLLLETAAGKDITAYLTLIVMPEKATREMLVRVLKRPHKYFSNEFISRISSLEELPSAAKRMLQPWQAERVIRFGENFSYLRHLHKMGVSPAGLVAEVINTFGLRQLYEEEELLPSRADQAAEAEMTEIFVMMSRLFEDIEEFVSFLHRPSGKHRVFREGEGVVLITVHRTKGNEYPYVIYLHMHPPEDEEDNISEEERRVCYVGVTRAVEKLCIILDRSKSSRFWEEMKKQKNKKNEKRKKTNQRLKIKD